MATSTDPQPQGQANPFKRRRQNPVSCQFCREKKLKCDRQSPCSNCFYRGLSCGNEPKPQPRSASDVVDNTIILERLKRLESTFLSLETRLHSRDDLDRVARPEVLQGSAGVWPWPSSAKPAAFATQDGPDRHKDMHFYPTPASEYAEAVQNLEGTGLRRDPWLPMGALDVEVRVATAQHIALLNSDPALRELLVKKATITCALPDKAEAVLLLDYYKDYLDGLQPILHIPTVHEHLDQCYTDISQGQQANPSILMLLLSIFASASAMMSHHQGEETSPISQSDATHLSTYWTGCALNLMRYHHNRSCDMVEVIQATILLSYLLLEVEGFSHRVHSYFTINVFRARDLSLHKIDAPGSWAPRSAVDMEIKRRIWWNVVTTDWVLSLSGGPQEGTYSVHPRQMAVNVPRNIDNKDMIHGSSLIDRPPSEPTTMSYHLQRIKLASLCREVVDLIPISVHDISPIDYQQVIALDQRFGAFLQELPIFLRNDKQSIQQSEHVVARYPQLRIQRQALSMLAKTRRCKLHQPFLIRGSVDSRYAYSRTISLKAARAVLEERSRIEAADNLNHVVDRHQLNNGYLIYHTFMATIVLVMDLCFNQKPSPNNSSSHSFDDEDDETRVTKAEVMKACRSLHQDQSAPGLGVAYLASLMDVLRKYQIRLRPPSNERGKNKAPVQPNTNVVPHQMTTSFAQLPFTPGSNSAAPDLTLSTTAPVRPIVRPLRRPVTNGTPGDQPPNTSSVGGGDDSFTQLNLNLGSSANNGPYSFGGGDQWPATGSVAPGLAQPLQAWLVDFEDIWNDYVELGPELERPYWDSLFSDLGPGMA
ncbi:Fungal Zn2-Cys6 binuclear cluster domain-containing protein [Cladophialophora immunda]|nr:Fungal Zn2-Cys6 binuclear cluster domain-containing protein [Cladophialophora immunda]